MKKRYERYFIILEEEDKGYSLLKSSGAKGYAKIENKQDQGILSIYFQNLKQLDDKRAGYRLYLIRGDHPSDHTLVDIGPINIDSKGKGELVWGFNRGNVKGSKKAIKDFDLIALTVENMGDTNKIIAPLVGYIHKDKLNWKAAMEGHFPIPDKEINQTLELGEELAGPQEISLKGSKLDSIQPKTQATVSPLQNYIEDLLKVFPQIEPFEEKLEDYKWWEIHYNERTIHRAYMPFISHVEDLAKTKDIDPRAISDYQRQFHRYQHYIFGIAYDKGQKVKYYIYGMPGKKTKLEQPYKGKTGFVYWHPCYQDQEQEGEFGYWLLHIDSSEQLVNPLGITKI